MIQTEGEAKKRKQWQEETKKLADAVSTQAQVSNRAWFAMITVVAFAVLPQEGADVQLPLGFGKVPMTAFYVIVYPILLILIITFAAAHAQQLNAQTFAQDTMDKLALELGHAYRGDRTWFDLRRKPSLNRVGPLVQLLRNEIKSQFLKKHPRFSKGLFKCYYALLKLIALIVYIALPGIALWHAFATLPFHGVIRWSFGFGGTIASFTLIQIAVEEVRYARKAAEYV